MLCKSCQSDILDGSDLWGYHHLSGDAADGCTFCSILREDVSGHKNVPDAPHKSKTSQKESHWWSVHKPGRIRESPDFVNVVFTPVAESAYADLPVRSFHLYEKGECGILYRHGSYFTVLHSSLAKNNGVNTQALSGWPHRPRRESSPGSRPRS